MSNGVRDFLILCLPRSAGERWSLRRRHKMTQKQMAAQTGLQLHEVQALERYSHLDIQGAHYLTENVLERAAAFYGECRLLPPIPPFRRNSGVINTSPPSRQLLTVEPVPGRDPPAGEPPDPDPPAPLGAGSTPPTPPPDPPPRSLPAPDDRRPGAGRDGR